MDAASLGPAAEQDKPLVVLVDLELKNSDNFAAIRSLKATTATAHLPILAQFPAMLDQAMLVESGGS